jgi:hypothetical protein
VLTQKFGDVLLEGTPFIFMVVAVEHRLPLLIGRRMLNRPPTGKPMDYTVDATGVQSLESRCEGSKANI